MDEELMERLMNELMEICWARLEEKNEKLAQLTREQEFRYDKLTAVLQENAPELEPLLESYIEVLMEKETEEDKLIYEQGAKDIVFLMKRLGIL